MILRRFLAFLQRFSSDIVAMSRGVTVVMGDLSPAVHWVVELNDISLKQIL